MTLATDIMEAVQRGGLANWTTTTKQPELKFSAKRKNETQFKMEKVYSCIKGWMTVAEVSKACGYCYDTTYKYIIRLMDDRKIIRSQQGQPHSYRRVL